MKKLRRVINASNVSNDKVCFTPSDVVTFLEHIAELRVFPISLNECGDGIYEITIGQSLYTITDQTRMAFV